MCRAPLTWTRPLEGSGMYCSLNNRRLHVLIWARAEGYLQNNLIGVRVKPTEGASRHAAKYSLDRCAAVAKVMREGGAGEAGAAADSAVVDSEDVAVDEATEVDAKGAHRRDGGASVATIGGVIASRGSAAAAAEASSGADSDVVADGCGVHEANADSTFDTATEPARATRQPAAFFCHGGGPMPVLGDPGHAPLVKSLRSFGSSLAAAPVAIIVVTAHWEERAPCVTSTLHPKLMFDYSGFPAEAYTLEYGAPGHPGIAKRATELLQGAGAQCDVCRACAVRKLGDSSRT